MDLSELGNSTAIMQLLQSQQSSLLLSQLATINGLKGSNQGGIPDASVMSDAPVGASSDATSGAAAAAGGSAGASGVVTDNAKESGMKSFLCLNPLLRNDDIWHHNTTECLTVMNVVFASFGVFLHKVTYNE